MQCVRSTVLLLSFVVASLPSLAQVVIATIPVGIEAGHSTVNSTTNMTYVLNTCGNDSTCRSNGTVTVIDGATFSTQTVTVGYSPYALATNPTSINKVYVVNNCGSDPTCSSNGTVTVIDGATLSTQTVTVGSRPGWVAVNPVTNKVYVTNNDGTVTVIDGVTLSTQTVTVGSQPSALSVNSVTNKIYVAKSDGTLTVIDGTTLSTQTVTVGSVPGWVAVNPVTNKIYVANFCGNDPLCGLGSSGTVTVIDGVTLSTQTITVGFQPIVLSVNSVTNKTYVANFCGNDQYCDSNGTVTVIDGATLSIQTVTVGSGPVDVQVDSVTNKTYVANQYGSCRTCVNPGTVTVIDGVNLSIVNVGVGIVPQQMAVNSSTDRIYVPSLFDNTVSVIDGTPPTALQFVPLAEPCRAVDTRPQDGGGGPIQGGTFQNFAISGVGSCGVLASAAAYSMNVSVVPQGPLSYLTVWPAGQPQPLASTLNSLDGRIKANAAIIPAGANREISVYATNTTNVIVDVNGYFAPVTDSTLAFYPLPPCRVADTRYPNGSGLGSPYLTGGQERDFPILNATPCNIPPNASAYSLNFSVVPHGALYYMTVWPTGPSQPVVSTLNDVPGQIIANAAIVAAGTGGDVSVYPTNDTDLIIDINGYFAPAGQGGLSLYGVSPCRVIDTRTVGSGQPFSGTLSPPVDVVDTGCAASSLAQAYVFNASVVPYGALGYLTLWPDGTGQPVVSTLNALDGSISSNMAIVPSANGKVDAYASGTTQLILDISSYFAP